MAKPQGNITRQSRIRPNPATAHRMRMEKASDPLGIATWKWVAVQSDPIFRLSQGPVIIRTWGRGKALTAFILLWTRENKRIPRHYEIESLKLGGINYAVWLENNQRKVIEPEREPRISRKASKNKRWREIGDAYREEIEAAKVAAEPAHERMLLKLEIAARVRNLMNGKRIPN